MAKDQAPDQATGEERTRVFDAPGATHAAIPAPPPLPPRGSGKRLTAVDAEVTARLEAAREDANAATVRVNGVAGAPGAAGSAGSAGATASAAADKTDKTLALDPNSGPGAASDAAAAAAAAASAASAAGVSAKSAKEATATRLLAPDTLVRPESDAARALRHVGEGAEATGRVAARATGWLGRLIRRFTGAGGARESGLSNLIELHAVNSVGDLFITLALAQTVFFGVQPGQARGKVALYLVITMVPFVLLAPVIGPLLDRFGHGRRVAMALTMGCRLILALIMARTVHTSAALALYPAAFGCLAASKAYGVARSAVIPRLLPPGTTLVKANSRTSMAGIAATVVLAPVAGLLIHLGAQYALVAAAIFFGLGAFLAIRLPAHVDSAEGEQKAQLKKRDRGMDPRLAETMPNLRLRSVGPAVVLALRANAAFRCFAGFLTIFIAFLVRMHPIGGYKDLVALGMVASAAAIGNALGTSLGSVLKARAPEAVISAVLALTTGAVLAAGFYYNLVTVLTVSLVAALSNALAKLSLDALLQRDTLERVRNSAFARSETMLQLAWVVGGGAGIAVSFVANGTFAFILASAAMLAVCLVTLKALSDLRFVAPNPAQHAGSRA